MEGKRGAVGVPPDLPADHAVFVLPRRAVSLPLASLYLRAPFLDARAFMDAGLAYYHRGSHGKVLAFRTDW